jgi:hypothetical protein
MGKARFVEPSPRKLYMEYFWFEVQSFEPETNATERPTKITPVINTPTCSQQYNIATS